MGWTKNDRFDFASRVKAYWPTQKDNKEELAVLLNLYADRLQGWKLSRVLTALENLKAAGSRFIPEIAEVHEECKKLSADQTREGYINRLKALGDPLQPPAYWVSPVGFKCYICGSGLVYKRPNGLKGSLIWSQLETADLALILADNESHIEYEPLQSWRDFVWSGGVEDVIARVESRGDDASFLREELPRWKRGAKLKVEFEDVEPRPAGGPGR